MARRLRDVKLDQQPNVPVSGEMLEKYVRSAWEVMKEQKRLGDELKQICADGDEAGAASKAEIRQLARERLKDPDIVSQKLERMDVLRRALGDFCETGLGKAASDRIWHADFKANSSSRNQVATGQPPNESSNL